MFAHAHEKEAGSASGRDLATLELTVNNHPGVMSHICGLFARRAFNLAGILCMPLEGNGRSRIWLLVEDGARIDQIVSQVAKLEDVLEVQNRSPDKAAFLELEGMFTHATAAP